MKHHAIRLDLLTAAVDRLPDNGLRAFRANALEQFVKAGLPNTSQEDWRYTNLEPAIRLSNEWLVSRNGNYDSTLKPIQKLPALPIETAIEANWLRFVNGRPAEHIRIDGDRTGVSVDTITSESCAAQLFAGDGLANLNASLLQDAISVRVPSGLAVRTPIGLLLASDATNGDKVSATRIVIELESNASMDVIESHLSLSALDAFANVVIEVRLAKGATLNYLRIQECGDAQILAGKLIASLDADSTLNYTSLDLGAALARNDVVADILAPGVEITATGLYLAGGAQHIDNHLRVDHRVGPARSQAEFRGILNGRARCVFNSKAIVHKGADGTDARQSNHNLLLSDKSEIDTKPELEIYADDVKCAHGATVGQLDKSALFYLKSRGIDEDTASQMLTRAFAASVLDKLPVAVAADYVTARVDRRLDSLIDVMK
ncbi:MAG: Fe-S cluster assembly protein SufD [Gammaproteobacteria bacterium]|nr:Fe-S cluster assembly protein SufD [Gammaproteobacteria bacterium]MDH4315517.1 Fe-S cluster assembly protein SufD [Gammaproteobacteria bacterium]MDH5214302.1 Fe-S cluster assembly protein SufD [Gammaproteobacteria bacterium]